MAIFGGSHTQAARDSQSSLRLPAQRRISTAAADRLSTITEGSNANAPIVTQPRGILRTGNSNPGSPARPTPSRQASRETAGRKSHETTRTGPPAYTWVPEPIGDEDLRAPVEGEKLAELRRNGGHQRRRRDRGGWGRLTAIVIVVLLGIVALAVGLGVGLTKKHRESEDSDETASQPAGTTPDTDAVQQFPLGEYSMITALRTVNTNCTSNPSTWRCYPYSTYNPADGSNTSSLATFNWIIANTSSQYATINSTDTTSPEGVPANLSISATNNPFSIAFSNQSLIYIAPSSNATAVRYTFSFTQPKSVIPSTSLLSSGAAAECFFNSTVFTGTLYLNVSSTFPGGNLADETGIGGYTPWPYALEISQRSGGGQDVPACYEMANGRVGDRILTATTPEPEGSECLCDYRNY